MDNIYKKISKTEGQKLNYYIRLNLTLTDVDNARQKSPFERENDP
jgi:hypothetical protein